MKKLVCLFIAALLMFTLSVSAFAAGGDKAPENPVSLEDQLIGLLLECTPSQRLTIINKAVAGEADMDKLAPYLTLDELQYVKDKKESYATDSLRMVPFLNVPPIKQESRYWCGAATIQMILNYMGIPYPFQSDIVDSITSSPSIDAVTSYVNRRISYTGKNYNYLGLSKNTDFGPIIAQCLSVATNNGKPMILQIANQEGDPNWPYATGGHYCLCDGLIGGGYGISDPFYFYPYIIPAPINEGRFIVYLSNIVTAINNWCTLHYTTVGYVGY